MFINCAEADVDNLYKIMIGAVVPRPIAWVSTAGKDGVLNLAPFSFFNCFGVEPPMVGFAPGWKEIEEANGNVVRVPKDTMRNVQETGEFVVNIVSHNLAERMNTTSAPLEYGVNEFERAGLTAAPSKLVAPPAVREALVHFECKLIQLFQHGNNNLVIGEVVGIRLADAIVNDRFHVNTQMLDAIGRLGGTWYTTTRDRFSIPRPSAD